MTAVTTTTTATPCNGDSSIDAEKSRSESFVPSASEEEAKTRFTTSVAAGVDFLMCRGVGREQASRELLNIVANGCSPDEEEVSYSYVVYFVVAVTVSCWEIGRAHV